MKAAPAQRNIGNALKLKTPPLTTVNDGAFERSLFRELILFKVTCSEPLTPNPSVRSGVSLFRQMLFLTPKRVEVSAANAARIPGAISSHFPNL
jgi:hypothetical protein